MISGVTAARAKLASSSLARRFLGGAAWSVFGSVLSSGLTLIMLMLLARLLGKEIYGQFVVIQSTLSMVGVFAGFGIGAAATRYAAELKTRDTVRLGHILTLAERTILGFGLLASTGLLLAAGWMAKNILDAPSLSVPLAISACAVLFTALDSYQKSVLIGFESMRAFAIGTVAGGVAGLPVMLVAATQFGLQGSAVAMVVNAVLQASISRHQMARELQRYGVQRHAKGCLSEWPVLWRFAFPALLSGALTAPTHWAAQAMLANTPNGYAELAVLGIATQWFNVIMFIPGTAGRVVLPILTDRATKNNYGDARGILLYAISVNAIISIPILIVVVTISPFLAGLYGQEYENDYPALILAAVAATLNATHGPLSALIIAEARVWLSAFLTAIWAAVYLGFTYVAIPAGAVGLLFGLTAAHLVFAVSAGAICFSRIRTKISTS